MPKAAARSATGRTNHHLSLSHARIVAATVFLLLLIGLVVFRLIMLQLVSGKYYRALAADQYTLVKTLTPSRGEIKILDKFSPDAYVVATSIDRDLVYAVPTSISNPQAAADSLAPILGLDAKDLLGKLADRTKKYVPLKHQLTDDQETKIKDLKLAGISFEPETFRFYPEKTLLSHVLGYVGYKGDNKEGLYGLEKFFQKQLQGTPGSLLQEKDATGAWIFGGKRQITPAKNGDNLLLTIDKTLQFKAETVIQDAVVKNGADSGSVTIMDPKTGAILAMANYPNFDPNEFNKVTDPAVFQNKATVGNYEPGSVFKPITLAAAIDQHKITPETTYTDTGQVVVDGYTIKNSDLKAHGVQTMTDVLDKSLNTGVIFAKEQVGNKVFLDYVQKFGFGKKTNVELPEATGNLSNLLTGNINVNYDTAAFGQGLSVTPIQLVEAYGALANGGKMMQPYIVQSRVDADGHVTVTQPKQVGQPISQETAATIGGMMVDVVEVGHGKKAGVLGYYVAGKTGTAQVPRKDGKGYEPNNNIGSFAGFAPVENPKFVMLVRVDHPRDVNFAETTAAPAWGQLAQFMLSYFNVAPNRPTTPVKK